MNRTLLIMAAIAAAAMGAFGGMRLASRATGENEAAPTTGEAAAMPSQAAAPTLRAFKRYPEPRVVADFALFDQHGEAFDLSRWQQRWTLVFFGFTHCPDICPSTMALMSSVLDGADLGDALGVTFVSVDPDRDSASHLADYVGFFDPRFDAATGPMPQLVALTHQLGVLFDIEPHEPDATSYNVDHSASVLLLNPQGRLVGQFPAPQQLELLVSDLKQLVGSNP
ncbi:MAG: SCO family protein [Pseudomonadota bacterium]